MTKQIPVTLKGATRMSTGNTVWAALIAAMLVAVTSVTQTQSTSSDQSAKQDSVVQQETQKAQGARGRPGNAIVGTWLSQISNGSKFIATFHRGGTVHITGQFDINVTNNVVLTPRQGVWKYLGDRRFGVTVLAIRYNPLTTSTTPPVPAGTLLSYLKIQYLLTISEDGQELTGMNIGTTIDPNGNVVGNPTINNNVPPYKRIEFEPFE